MQRLGMIVAHDLHRGIGKDGKVPWHYIEDLRFFRQMTIRKPVLMGRKTYESIGKPLPGRANYVLSRKRVEEHPNLFWYMHPNSALRSAYYTHSCPMIAGGAEIYNAFLEHTTHLFVTVVNESIDGPDVFFPAISAEEWTFCDYKKLSENCSVFCYVRSQLDGDYLSDKHEPMKTWHSIK